MKDYNYSELKDMQERAMERVKSMQQRAKETADAANLDFSEKPIQKYGEYNSQGYNPPVNHNQNQNTRQHHIKMPVTMPKRESEYQSFNEYFQKENSEVRETNNNRTKANLIESVLKEPDEAVLFSLLLLLRSEGSDEALMMALLYIMS